MTAKDTVMLTHGQSDFFNQYIDPDSKTVRSYYTDFLFERDKGTMVIVEVKGERQRVLELVASVQAIPFFGSDREIPPDVAEPMKGKTMAINISDEDETRSYKLFSRLVEKLEDEKIDSFAAIAACVHILKLAANEVVSQFESRAQRSSA